MGRWLAGFLRGEGQQVVISGRDERKLALAAKQLGIKAAGSAEAIRSADAIILSLPIDSFESIVQEISTHFRQGQLIFDITSVKAMPVKVMHRYIKKGTVLGTHPMFGPGASGIAGKHFVLTPTDNKEAELAEKVRRYLEAKNARVTIMTPEEHDRTMSIVLGLSHFIGLVAADTLAGLENLNKTLEAGGTTYRMLLTMAESVVSEDPAFYASLQMNLPGMDKIHRLLQDKVEIWAGLVSKKDAGQFARRMSELKKRLEQEDPDFAGAYQNMYTTVERYNLPPDPKSGD